MNNTNIQELSRANAELNALVARMLTDTDALFASRTWRIGYRVANLMRGLQRLLGNNRAQTHIGPDHFRAIAASYFACQSRAYTAPAIGPDGVPEIPSTYILSDVEVVIRDLWTQASRTSAEHA
jgi:hypothetical protein